MFCKCRAPDFPNKQRPLMITIFTSLIIPLVTNGLSFNFSSFPVGVQDIVFQGVAFPANGVIQLTGNLWLQSLYKNHSSFGRAVYHKPLHLWDNTKKELTDFTTHYSFVIDVGENDTYGDGLAFFLAPNGTSLPPASNRTLGRTLGLTWDNQELNTSMNHFVAVEFDIFRNFFDAHRGRHVGIDINSMQSVNSTRFVCNIVGGEKCEAWISYDSRTHNLSAVFGSTNISNSVSISYIVNLMEYLPEWVTFGFSGSTGAFFAAHRISSWEFNSTLRDDLTKTNSGLVVGLTVGVVLVVVVVVGVVWFVVMRRRKNCEDEEDDHISDAYMDEVLERGTGPRRFSYRELAQATNNFSYEDKLGEGGFGTVYKGFIKQINAEVAVKRVSRGSKQGIKEYTAEVRIINRLRHRNLVQLTGWCHERKELLLVYEFLPNGTLHSHLFKDNMLRWELRYKIAKDLGAGLLYLHEGWEQCVLHRDIKASNIMLDSEFNAKLGDFGLAKLVDHMKGSQTTIIAGTMGYMAPECATTGKASKEADVYSFGVVALEIASGRRAMATEDDSYIVEWVWNIYESAKLLQAADPRLNGDFNEREMERLIVVGLCCANPDASFRPSIRQALHVLNFEAPLPKLPSKMPVPTFLTPPSMDMYSSSAFPSAATAASVLSSTSAATSVTS